MRIPTQPFLGFNYTSRVMPSSITNASKSAVKVLLPPIEKVSKSINLYKDGDRLVARRCELVKQDGTKTYITKFFGGENDDVLKLVIKTHLRPNGDMNVISLNYSTGRTAYTDKIGRTTKKDEWIIPAWLRKLTTSKVK